MNYERPPIVECVLEFRYQAPIPKKQIDQIVSKLKKFYPIVQDRIKIDTEFDGSGEVTAEIQKVGFELRSNSSLEMVRIQGASFLTAELAPYSGWTNFSKRAFRDFRLHRKIIGPVGIARLGLRYVNRIDIEIEDGAIVPFSDYLRSIPQMPDVGPQTLNEYSSRITKPSGTEGISFTVIGGTIESPLAGHKSLLVDIDVFSDELLPNNTAKVAKILDTYREIKNEVFEAIITDHSRNLFGLKK